MTSSKVSSAAKRLLLGAPVRSDKYGPRLLPKRIALPVFASDALSSVAYAPEEIFLVLSAAGVSAYAFAPWIGLAVAVVMLVVVACYRQNVRAYPLGGGDYHIAKLNLGPNAGLAVGSALMVDYVLTVAVSVSAAAANVGSAIPVVGQHKELFAVCAILLLTALNLRGVREDSRVFAAITYLFLIAVFALLGIGLARTFLDSGLRAESASFQLAEPATQLTGLALAFLLARSFSSGSVALTGVEAVSTGVPAFRKPKARNAATTLLMLGALGVALLLGIIMLAQRLGVVYAADPAALRGAPEGYHQQTVLVQIAHAVFGGLPGGTAGFWLVIATTALVLALAANTAFNGFPVLASVISRDSYLPRQLHTRGDRLAFSNGVLALAAAAVFAVVVSRADLTTLIQLYIVGVFASFVLTQAGMVRHWGAALAKETDPAARRTMQRSRVINATGLVLTAVVLVIVLATKLAAGAWIAVAAMVAVYVVMRMIHAHYESVAHELEYDEDAPVVLPSRTHSVVLVSKLHRPTRRALAYARATRPDILEAITVAVDPADTRQLARAWEKSDVTVPLKVIESPYREITRPVLEYVQRIHRTSPRDVVTVFIPEYVVGHWWEHLLHNQSALRLKSRLLFEKGVMVTSVPWQLESSQKARPMNPSNSPGASRRGY
jgi:amino acid transporter